MEIHVLESEMKHKGGSVYMRQFAHIFEYLLIWGGKLYSFSIEVKPSSNKHGDLRDFTKEEIIGAKKSLWALARTTIETLNKAKADLKSEAKGKSTKHGKNK